MRVDSHNGVGEFLRDPVESDKMLCAICKRLLDVPTKVLCKQSTMDSNVLDSWIQTSSAKSSIDVVGSKALQAKI